MSSSMMFSVKSLRLLVRITLLAFLIVVLYPPCRAQSLGWHIGGDSTSGELGEFLQADSVLATRYFDNSNTYISSGDTAPALPSGWSNPFVRHYASYRTCCTIRRLRRPMWRRPSFKPGDLNLSIALASVGGLTSKWRERSLIVCSRVGAGTISADFECCK